MQTVGIFVTSDVAQFITFGGDFSVGVVAEFSRLSIGLGEFQQAPCGVPLILRQRAMLILTRNLSSNIVIAITLNPTIRQLFLNELSTLIPNQPMRPVIRIPNPNQLPVFVVGVVCNVAVRICLTRNVALFVTLILPNRFTPPHNPYEPVIVLVGCRLILPRKQRHQTSGFVVLIRRHRPQRVLLDRQPTLVIVGFEMLSAIGIDRKSV